MKWQVTSIEAVPETMIFEVSPNQMESPMKFQGVTIHGATWDGQIRGTRLDQARPWSFSGVILTQSQYEDMRDWVRNKGLCILTDHLNRQFKVRLTAFTPTRAPWRHYPWRHKYSVSVTTYEGPL